MEMQNQLVIDLGYFDEFRKCVQSQQGFSHILYMQPRSGFDLEKRIVS